MQRRKRKRIEMDFAAPEPTIETVFALTPVIDSVFAFASPEQLVRLSATSRFFCAHYQDESFWKQKYLADFGQLTFEYDYRWQYVAEHLFRRAQQYQPNYLNRCKFKAFILQHAEKNWAHYYHAVLSEYDELGDPQHIFENETTIDHAFKALELGDLRGASFLINYVDNKFEDNSFHFSRLASLTEKLTAMLCVMPNTGRLLCFIQCLLARPRDEHASFYQQQALAIFTNLIEPNSTLVADFIKFSSEVFRRSGLLSSYQTQLLCHTQTLLNCATVNDVITHFISDKRLHPTIRSALNEWRNHCEKKTFEQEPASLEPAQQADNHYPFKKY